jgi:Uma2 family endonuclease
MATKLSRRGWSYAEYARLPDDGNRYEVIAGELVVSPAPRTIHQEVSARFFLALRTFATSQHKLGTVLYAPIDVLFGEGDYMQPDLIFVREDREDISTERGIEGPPDLVVEVLSPSTAVRDRGIKRERYAFYGVPEYWIVDADARHVEVYRLQDDPDHAEIATERLRWEPVPGGPVLELDVDELFAGLV